MIALELYRLEIHASFQNQAFCTAKWWRSTRPGELSNLDYCVTVTGIADNARGAHSALEDAVLAAQLLRWLLGTAAEAVLAQRQARYYTYKLVAAGRSLRAPRRVVSAENTVDDKENKEYCDAQSISAPDGDDSDNDSNSEVNAN